jgi:oxidoreductase
MSSSSNLSALLLGATGETGRELLKHLCACNDYSKIILVGRRKPDGDPCCAKIEQRIVDFDNLDTHEDSFKGADVAFCCLGTTRGKAGKEGFIKVDHDYVVNSAKILKTTGCKDFHLLTSKGSDPNSWFLYPQTKVKEMTRNSHFRH